MTAPINTSLDVDGVLPGINDDVEFDGCMTRKDAKKGGKNAGPTDGSKQHLRVDTDQNILQRRASTLSSFFSLGTANSSTGSLNPVKTLEELARHERYLEFRANAASWAQLSPLIAAILGPLSILLGIPALAQRE